MRMRYVARFVIFVPGDFPYLSSYKIGESTNLPIHRKLAPAVGQQLIVMLWRPFYPLGRSLRAQVVPSVIVWAVLCLSASAGAAAIIIKYITRMKLVQSTP
jgi:hypothetical protein